MNTQEARNLLAKKNEELAAANAEFGQAVLDGETDQAQTVKQIALALEEQCNDLRRILGSGVLNEIDATEQGERARQVEEAITAALAEGKRLQAAHAIQLQKVLEQKAAYLQSIRKLGEICRNTNKVAARVRVPATIRPKAIEHFVRDLVIPQETISETYGYEGKWF